MRSTKRLLGSLVVCALIAMVACLTVVPLGELPAATSVTQPAQTQLAEGGPLRRAGRAAAAPARWLLRGRAGRREARQARGFGC